MKLNQILTVSATLLLSVGSFAQDFPVVNVEVHERGAWLEQKGVAIFTNGNSLLEISGLPVDLNESKIQVELKPGVYLQNMQYTEEKSPNSNTYELKNITDSIHMLTVRIQMFEALKHTLNEEREFLKANRQIGSSQEVLLVDDLIEMADFLRERNQDLGLELLDVEMDIQVLQEELEILNRRLVKTRGTANGGVQMQGVLNLDLRSDNSSQSSEISIRYLTADAGWNVEYEVFFEENEVFVKRKANIAQHTGLDWSEASISLITGRPMDELSLGELDPWVIDSAKPFSSGGGYFRGAKSRVLSWDNEDDNGGEDEINVDEIFNFASNARYVFDLEGKSRVSAGKGKTLVELDNFVLNGDIRYKAAPSANSESYVTVRCADWLGNKLMNGEGRIISGNTYLGDFFLSVPSVGDTLVIPLGTDPHLRCSRELVAESSSSSFLAGKKEMVQTWELKVENSHTDSVEVDLVDKLPVSRFENSEIEISAEASDNGEVDLINGFAVYSFGLAPLETRKVTLTIRVKYPSKRNLQSF